MPTTVYVARNLTDEQGPWNLLPFTLAEIIGADPLATNDGETSYVRLRTDKDSRAITGVRFSWEPITPVPPSGATLIEARGWLNARGTYGRGTVSYQHPVATGVSVWGGIAIGSSIGVTGVPPRDFDAPDWTFGDITPSTFINPGTRFWLLSDPGPPNFVIPEDFVLDVTRLWVVLEWEGGETPLRIRQRGDGLGMGGPRVRGVGSRQRSPRVRGYV